MKVIIYGTGLITEDNNPTNDFHVGSGNAFNSGIEFNCARYGISIVGYIQPNINKTSDVFKDVKIIELRELASIEYDYIIINNQFDKSDVHLILSTSGIDTKKALSFKSDFHTIIRAFESSSSISIRHHSVVGIHLETITKSYDISKKSISDVDTGIDNAMEEKIINGIFSAHQKTINDSERGTIPSALRVGKNWYSFLQATRPNFYSAIENKNLINLKELLRNFYRNEMSSGILGGNEAYQAFCNDSQHAGNFRRTFNVWKNSLLVPNIEQLACKKVGNPYGVYLNGNIVHANNMLNHYRASMTMNLLADIEKPIVMEVGGGYGGYAESLLSCNFHGTYINFDLPENLIVSSYYLMMSFPDKKILTYQDDIKTISRAALEKYDIVLLPHYLIEKVEELAVDLAINTISFSEMDFNNISNYLSRFSKTSRHYIYHENMLDGGAGYEFYPVSTFPPLNNFKLIFSSPSRWPWFSINSAHHHHAEFLYERR
ncbi:putative sugar O-methyltransferase [Aeromonas hydrophila]|uniref:putative sugar O-methyltransferase n=1 Tax=Aeromonas hydrophila TaxID=644 RepID=UPI002B45B8AA|nr:putative sugar O-methyltransferase [Aeromonas hydrophila]